MAMDALRCPPDDVRVTSCRAARSAAWPCARLLLSKPDMLLLDEPTNHLDAESVAWLQHHLEEFPGCVILVTHDRYFLDQVTKWTLELDRGKGVPYEGNYSGWLEQKTKRAEVEKAAGGGPPEARSPANWNGSAPRPRPARPSPRPVWPPTTSWPRRPAARTRARRIDPDPARARASATWCSRSRAWRRPTATSCCSRICRFKLPPSGIVGVIGPNGAGKSTLFKMITGQEKPDAGTITLGETVKLAYVDQSRDALDAKKTVWEEISGGLDVMKVGDKREIPSRAYCGWFNFKGADQQKKVGLLSGGERNRVHLAKTLTEGGNLLLLDEPTNDLDIETLGASKRRWRTSPAAPWSSPTTASSSTAWRPTSWPSRATATSNGSKATSKPTRRTRSAASATPRSSRTASSSSASSGLSRSRGAHARGHRAA